MTDQQGGSSPSTVEKSELATPGQRRSSRKRVPVLLPSVHLEIKEEDEDEKDSPASLWEFHTEPEDWDSRRHRCSVCGKGFKVKADLVRHTRTHTGEKPYACEICGKAFAIIGNLSKHRRTHSDERPYTCTLCDKTYKQQKHLKQHMDLHNGVKNYHCGICDRYFNHSWSWYCHMANHAGTFRYTCHVCKKGFNSSTDYRRHLFTHGGKRPLKCPHCEHRFAHGSLLKKHVAVHHTARNLKCNRCGEVFELLADFKKHRLSHKGEKHLKCEWCGKAFGKLSHLKRHYKVHKGRPAQCSVCEASFKTKEELLSHTETHIDIQDSLVQGKEIDLGGKEDFSSAEIKEEVLSDVNDDENCVDVDIGEFEVCTLCKKRLSSKSEFVTHMEEHINALGDLGDSDDELDDEVVERKLNMIKAAAVELNGLGDESAEILFKIEPVDDIAITSCDDPDQLGANTTCSGVAHKCNDVTDSLDHRINDNDKSDNDGVDSDTDEVILTKIANDVTGFNKTFFGSVQCASSSDRQNLDAASMAPSYSVEDLGKDSTLDADGEVTLFEEDSPYDARGDINSGNETLENGKNFDLISDMGVSCISEMISWT